MSKSLKRLLILLLVLVTAAAVVFLSVFLLEDLPQQMVRG